MLTNKLREARLERNLLQKDVARALHCTTKTISRYESGESIPNNNVAFRLAKCHGWPIEDLFYSIPDNAKNNI